MASRQFRDRGLTLTSVWSRHKGVGVMILQVTVGPIGRVEMGLWEITTIKNWGCRSDHLLESNLFSATYLYSPQIIHTLSVQPPQV